MRAKLYEIARKKTACVFRSVRLPSLFPVTPNSFITVNFYVRARKNMILTLLLSILFCSAKFQIADATSRVESTRHTSRFIHRGFPREKLISFHERLIKNVEGSSKALLNANLTCTKTFYQVLGQNISIWDNDKSFTSDLVAHEINGGEYRLLDMERLRMIRDGDTVLDLGSNVGITAIVVAKMFPTVRVIGVEPVPYNFAAALRNVDENGVADRVTILNAALTRNASSTARIVYSIRNPGSSTADREFYSKGSDDEYGHREFDVNGVTVDEIIDYFRLDRIPFIKLDCEGCEYDIVPNLSGRTLKMFREAFVAGETHCDRMTVPNDTIAFVHSVYDEYVQSGPGGCLKTSKKWNPLFR